MLQNAYFLAKFGADTAENERKFAEFLFTKTTTTLPYPSGLSSRGDFRPPDRRRVAPRGALRGLAGAVLLRQHGPGRREGDGGRGARASTQFFRCASIIRYLSRI